MTFAYGNMPLDRCTNQRKNKRWLSAEFNHGNTLFCVLNEGMTLVKDGEVTEPIYLSKAQLPTVNVDSCIYLGKASTESLSSKTASLAEHNSESVSIFAIDFDKLRFSTQEELSDIGKWQRLREITINLSDIDASTLALAKGLVHWHKTNQYCGLCGNANRAVEAGHARRCSHCRNMTFPRTDPAVIMLVEKMFDDGIPRCLLGRQASWAKGVYSMLAGFVDPGETLEQAVIREVAEETAIKAENPQYVASQPWPFPSSIMLGFTAVATTETIDISHDDLEDAQWFTREQLSQFGSSDESDVNNVNVIDSLDLENSTTPKPQPKYRMSTNDSISAHIIKAWMNKEIGKYRG